MSIRKKYNTKFSALTLAIGFEPDVYIRNRLSQKWHPMQIYNELYSTAHRKNLPMVDRRTIYLWIDRAKARAG